MRAHAFAEDAGKIGSVHVRLLGEMPRHVGLKTRDERVLTAIRLTSEQPVLAIDATIWDGVSVR